jgi:hypothetical protein
MIKIVLISLFFVSTAQAACLNKIPQSEAIKAIAQEPGAGAKACDGSEPCLCFDGIDWETAEIKAGVLVENAGKRAAKDAKIAKEISDNAAREASRKAARDVLKAFKKSDIKTPADAADLIQKLVEALGLDQ